jgi:hypothetical protein
MNWRRRKRREQDLERELCADLELEAEEQHEQAYRRRKHAMLHGRLLVTSHG